MVADREIVIQNVSCRWSSTSTKTSERYCGVASIKTNGRSKNTAKHGAKCSRITNALPSTAKRMSIGTTASRIIFYEPSIKLGTGHSFDRRRIFLSIDLIFFLKISSVRVKFNFFQRLSIINVVGSRSVPLYGTRNFLLYNFSTDEDIDSSRRRRYDTALHTACKCFGA